jgi:glycosyltransferase involved in cell wall biosynthesis
MTCVSPAVRDALKRWERWSIGDAGIEIVYTGVDIDSTRAASELAWSVRDIRGVPETGILVGHAGRLVETKAQDILIEGIAEVIDRLDEDVYLIIAGDGPRRAELEEIAKEAAIEDHVIFPGLLSREKAYKLMADVDVLAMPSKWEGFSSSVAEAMSVGTPCLLSDIQAFREPFHGVARFHPVGDADALARELSNLLIDDSLRRSLGDSARQRIENKFTIKRTAKEYARIYHEIV